MGSCTNGSDVVAGPDVPYREGTGFAGLRGLRYGSVNNDLLEKEQFVTSHLRSFVMSGAFRHERCRMTMNKEHEHAVLCSVPCHATKKTEVQLQMAAGCRTILQQQTDHVARNSVQPDTGFDALDRCCHATTFSYHLNHLNFGKF